MLSLYEILKASKTGIAPDMWTALAGKNWGGAGSGAEVKELTGIPPLSFTADGTPLLDYLISGNMEQSGTPTPTTSIQPQETGERTGNLLDYTTVENTTNATATPISGGINISGKYFVRFRTVKFTVGTSYTMSWTTKTISGTVSTMWRFHYSDNTYSAMPSSGWSLIAKKEVSALLLYVNGSSTETGVAEITNIMLNESSTALPYTPYGIKIPISSAGQTTNIYLGEVQTTRRIKKLVLTGEESGWTKNDSLANSNAFYRTISGYYRYSGFCTHYATVDSAQAAEGVFFGSNINFLTALSDNIDTIDKWKNYLRQQYAVGTPVTIWYVLATPETAVVNEPLRKIGDYADTVSMEQAGVSIPTLHGNTIIDVLTELKPSEMYIKYQE